MFFYDSEFKEYSLGTVLDFSSIKYNIINYSEYGVSVPEGNFAWLEENEASFLFHFSNDVKVIKGILDIVNVYHTAQRINIYANDTLVYNGKIGEPQKINFIFPNAPDGNMRIRFVLPDAISPYKLNESDDARILSIAIKDLIFEKYKANKISLNENINFVKSNNNYKKYFTLGISDAEILGTWTDGKVAIFSANFEDEKIEIASCQVMLANIFNGSQHVQIFANGNEVFNKVVQTKDGIKFNFIIPNERQVLFNFVLKDAKKNEAIKENVDNRELGLMFESISFSKVNLTSYKLNTKLGATKNDFSIMPYVFNGLSFVEDEYTWIEGKSLFLGAYIEDLKNNQNVKCQMHIKGIIGESQKVLILASGKAVFLGKIDHNIDEIDFNIKNLETNDLILELFLADAISPHLLDINDNDKRLLSVKIESITFC